MMRVFRLPGARLGLVSLFFVLSACTTTENSQTFKGRFEREPDYWRNGLGYVESQNQGMTVGYALSEVEENTIRFLVSVTNRQKKPFLVDSTQFSISDSKNRIQAQHPDFLMAEIDKAIRAKESQLESTGADHIVDFVDLTLTVTDAASDLSGRESKKEVAEREEREKKRSERESDRLERESVLRDEISVLKAQKKYIAEKFLRKTTLAVGETLHGFIQFRVPNAAGEWSVSADFTPAQNLHIESK